MHSYNLRKTRNLSGFTLVELTIVLVIIALVTSMGMVASVDAIKGAKRVSTSNRMDEIEKALMSFRERYGRLPCPANPTLLPSSASYGKEIRNSAGTACDISNGTTDPPNPVYYLTNNADSTHTVEGAVPTASLELPNEFMYDGWGRKFMYAIPPVAGDNKSFSQFIRAQDSLCTGAVKDNTGATRSSGAVYVLTSFGPNGHGGFNSSGTRLNNGVSEANELINCRCNSSGVFSAPSSISWVQSNLAENTSLASVFDDIVRYKERWQMQTVEDNIKSADYKDYVLAVNYASQTSLKFYKFNGCRRRWEAHTTTSVTPGGTITAAGNVVFDGKQIFFRTDSTTNPIQPYYVTRDSVVAATCSPITTCVPVAPAYAATYPAAISANHYVALGYNAAPYVQIYRAANTTTATPLLAPVITKSSASHLTAFVSPSQGQPTRAWPASEDPSAQPTLIAFSKNAEYLFLSDKSTYAKLYARTNDTTYKLLDTSWQPSVTASTVGSAAFSPDGKYFAIGVATASSAIKIWRIKAGNPFHSGAGTIDPFTSAAANVATSTFTTVTFPGTVAPLIAFSPDSQYLVATGGVGSSAGTIAASGNIFIFKIDDYNTFTSIKANISGSYSTDVTPIQSLPVLFTPDSNHFLVPVTKAGGADILQFQKDSVDTWSLSASPSPFETNAAAAMTITPP